RATGELGLTISVNEVGEGHASAASTHVLSVYGADRPGLLAGVSRAMADNGVNITDVETRLLSPDAETPVYAMFLELVLPDRVSESDLRSQLDGLTGALGIDHSLRALETETY
ncbi:MAG TPA: ACT domain-containing protein, partial [Nitriliruptorales bacterium]